MSHFPYQFLKSMYSVRLYFHIKIQKKFNEEVVSNRELEEICKDPVFLEGYIWHRPISMKEPLNGFQERIYLLNNMKSLKIRY